MNKLKSNLKNANKTTKIILMMLLVVMFAAAQFESARVQWEFIQWTYNSSVGQIIYPVNNYDV